MALFLLLELIAGASIAITFFIDGAYYGGILVVLTMLISIGLGILGTFKANQIVMYLVSALVYCLSLVYGLLPDLCCHWPIPLVHMYGRIRLSNQREQGYYYRRNTKCLLFQAKNGNQ